MTALYFIGSPSFFQVIFTVIWLTLQVNRSLSPSVSVGYGFGLTLAVGFSVLRERDNVYITWFSYKKKTSIKIL